MPPCQKKIESHEKFLRLWKSTVYHYLTLSCFPRGRGRHRLAGAFSVQLFTDPVAAALCAALGLRMRGTECRGYTSIKSALKMENAECKS
jgi:hypothetical protein